MRIVFLDAKTVGDLQEIDQLHSLGKVTIYPTTSHRETIDRIKESDIVITNKVILNEEVLTHAKKLKLICIAATGTNNVDLRYCNEKGIIVKNAAGYSTKSVAQFTFNCLLYFIHKTNYYDQYVKSGEYVKSDIFTHIHHDFFELNGKKFGIIGLGSIGTEVARLANAFGAAVGYFSTSGKNNSKEFQQFTLEELLSDSDIISIHCPLNENTTNLLGEEELKKMKRSAILINMGRGGIINEKGLTKALNNGWIGGAITDVLTKEPIEALNPLLHLKNPNSILITPHIAWASLEARKNLLQIVINNIKDFQKGLANFQ